MCRRCKIYSSFSDLAICQRCYNDFLIEVYGRDENGNNTIDESKMTKEEQMAHTAKAYEWNLLKNRR